MVKETLIFIISSVGGEIAIKVEHTHGEFTMLWRGNPLELTADILNRYQLSKDTISYDYVSMVHKDYGTIQEFEKFQWNFKGFLKHLRNI